VVDERVAAFRNRTLGHVAFPYVYLDATYVNVRDDALGSGGVPGPMVDLGDRVRRG
jgi:transposase-like protein